MPTDDLLTPVQRDDLRTIEDYTVTWSGYRTGHRDWDYRELRDFTFDRAQYERAVRATER